MTNLTLTPEELLELTGFSRKSKQAQWLKSNGIKYRLNAQLQPRVDRTHYLVKMGAAQGAKEMSGPSWGAIESRA